MLDELGKCLRARTRSVQNVSYDAKRRNELLDKLGECLPPYPFPPLFPLRGAWEGGPLNLPLAL